MGLHPAERVREYRAKGYWTDDMIDALLCERVRQFGDIPAIVDPLNGGTLLDGPLRSLTWPQLDEQVSRLPEIVAYLRGLGIATYKLPERLELRDELPRNPLGKILKRELRDELRSA